MSLSLSRRAGRVQRGGMRRAHRARRGRRRASRARSTAPAAARASTAPRDVRTSFHRATPRPPGCSTGSTRLFAEPRPRRSGCRSGRSAEPVQIVRYDDGGHFATWHSDAGLDQEAQRPHLGVGRALPSGATMTAASSRSSPTLVGRPRTLPRGGARIFPSRALHRVTPVTRGVRYALVDLDRRAGSQDRGRLIRRRSGVFGQVEASRPAQLGEPSRPEQGDSDRADAAGDHRRDRPDQGGEEAAFRLAQLVRGGDEQGRDGADPAAHRVGRVELDQRLADIDREHVGGAEQGEAERATAPSSATGRRRWSPRRTRRPRRASWRRHCASAAGTRNRARSASRRPPARRADGRGRSAPIARMSRAKTGSIAVAPPSRTANRSSEMAPSTSRLRRT